MSAASLQEPTDAPSGAVALEPRTPGAPELTHATVPVATTRKIARAAANVATDVIRALRRGALGPPAVEAPPVTATTTALIAHLGAWCGTAAAIVWMLPRQPDIRTVLTVATVAIGLLWARRVGPSPIATMTAAIAVGVCGPLPLFLLDATTRDLAAPIYALVGLTVLAVTLTQRTSMAGVMCGGALLLIGIQATRI